ncbi:DUF4374 domain-containing protein [Bermanella marisrubri]|uniref:Lipoprotein n=1 Tax=Bermanella marisrubri TaxID=207949 RepID=Q1N1B0_9GAMM|nr:DUF4374 domain-containing protein [Bermanella marisrubri]EAT11941.1 hypothetical protein RED65_11390 [Oceanobacter sp. RED65] [Bermanella marisrubri]QIZ84746.1 DUF4374 domain-containing protein [Bermanella marisrubri]
MKKSLLALTIAATVGLTACGSDDSSNAAVDGGVTLAFKQSGDTETEFLLTSNSLESGSITNQGAGNEQLGWNFYYRVGDTLFVTGYENYEANAYVMNDEGQLEVLNTFFYDRPLQQFGNVNDTTLLATDPSYSEHGPLIMYTISAETGRITSKVDYTIHDLDTGTAGEGTVAWPTALVVRDDKLFIPFQKFDDGGNFTTPDVNKAYVAVYNYPLTTENNEPLKIIEDDRTSNIGVNGDTNGLIQTDSGDLYSYSNGAVSGGFAPASTKPSGILRINNGEDEFDSSYFFNIEEETEGGKMFWMEPIGGEKAIARIFIPTEATETLPGGAWSAFYKSFHQHKLVILDLANKTVTDVEGVPMHQKRYTSPLEIKDGKVLVSIETNEGTPEAPDLQTHVYSVDLDTATAVKGAKVEGAKTVKGFFDLN